MKKIRNWLSYRIVLLAILIFSQLFFVNKVLAVEAVDQCFCVTNTNSTCFSTKDERECNAMSQSGAYLSCRLLTISRVVFGDDIAKKNQLLSEECQFEKQRWDDSHKPRVDDQAQNAGDADSLIDLKTRTQSKLNPLKWLGATGTLGVNTFIGKILIFLMWAIGSLLLLFYVYAGVLWMTAAGNAEQITKAKHIMLWATLSIIVQFTSYFLVRALFTLF